MTELLANICVIFVGSVFALMALMIVFLIAYTIYDWIKYGGDK